LRPGRLDRKIEFPLPDRRQKRLVFQASFFCISLCYNSIYAIIIMCQCHYSIFIVNNRSFYISRVRNICFLQTSLPLF
jgi:hypothetical protein